MLRTAYARGEEAGHGVPACAQRGGHQRGCAFRAPRRGACILSRRGPDAPHGVREITVGGDLAQSARASLWKFETATGKYQHYADVFADWQTGHYSFSVPDGAYLLRTKQEGFADEWYDDTYFTDEAEPITVAGADVSLPVIDLSDYGTVTGTVTGDGEPLSCPTVTWYRQDRSGTFRWVADSSPYHGEHRYTAVLDPGTYKVRASDGCLGFRARWYGGTVSMAHAEKVVVPSGARMSIGNIDLKDAPTILGTLVRPDGTPVRRVQVSARVADDPTGNNYWATDRSDQQGRFRLQVGGVSTKLRFYDPESHDGPDQWYQSWTPEGSPTITLGPDDDDLDLGAVTVQPGGTLAGRVTRTGGKPTARTRVTLYASDQPQDGVFTDRQGRYRITDLVPGDYQLGFSQDGLVTEFHDDSRTLADATPVPAVNATVTTVDAELTETPNDLPDETDIFGFVTGPGGRPEPGVRVCAKDVPANPYAGFCRGAAVTDVRGRYALTTIDNASTGTDASEYKLEFDPPSGAEREPGLVAVFSGGAPSYEDADSVPLPTTTDPVRFDIEMDAYGAVSGTLTTSAGDPPRRGTVKVYDDSGTRIRDLDVDEDGGYAADLPPGDYRVLFSGYEEADLRHGYHPYVPVWWHERDSLASATVVTVGEDEYVANIDAALHDRMVASRAPTVSGSPTVGSSLEADPGQWNGASPAYFTYEWLRDDVVVASGETYTVTSHDGGHSLRVRVTANIFVGDEASFHGSATSAPVDVPPADTDPSAQPPSDPGSPAQVGRHETVTSVAGSYSPRNRPKQKPARIILRIRVSASGPTHADGTVEIKEGARVLAGSLRLVDGVAVVVIKRPAPGRHRYAVSYAGSPTALPSRGAVIVHAR